MLLFQLKKLLSLSFILSTLLPVTSFAYTEARATSVCGARGEDAGAYGKVTFCRCNGNYYKLLDDTNPCLRRPHRKADLSAFVVEQTEVKPNVNGITAPAISAMNSPDFSNYLSQNRSQVQEFEAVRSETPAVFKSDALVQRLIEVVKEAESENRCPKTPEDIVHLKNIFEKGHAIRLEEQTDFSKMVGIEYRVCGYNEYYKVWYDLKRTYSDKSQYIQWESNCTTSFVASAQEPFRFEARSGCGNLGIHQGGILGDIVVTSLGHGAYLSTVVTLDKTAWGYFLMYPVTK